jgi:uncharacterized lipoprotein YddW (UPF0748 family)
MYLSIRAVALSLFVFASPLSSFLAKENNVTPPKIQREFRAAWVATVANIDWPSQKGLPVAQQKEELIAILDKSKALNLNALVFQVRPACDALYDSKFEPWSEYITGKMGQAPEPFYDPLEFIVEEAHKRGIELHAWVNPYRARHTSALSEVSDDHVTKARPELAVRYGKYMWLDPGLKEVQDYSVQVIMDIVARYDIDGMHLDDYFYPYREKNSDGEDIEFPDEASWMAFVSDGGAISREDWRRENVNTFLQRLYQEIKSTKPWVKFGISPFGIWQPGFPEEITGMNAFEQIYCDSRKWWNEGTCDYIAPQLYWKISSEGQSYPALLRWWASENKQKRHLWPGNFTSRIVSGEPADDKQWRPDEIVNQVKLTQMEPVADGNIHFSMKPLMENRAGIGDALRQEAYQQPALVPASPWLNSAAPAQPALATKRDTKRVTAAWTGSKDVWQWAVQKRINGEWHVEILPAEQTSLVVSSGDTAELPDAIAVTAVSRVGVASKTSVSILD